MIRTQTILPTVLALWLTPLAADARPPGRILAMGDVHGAYEPLVEILETAGLIDEGRHWAGGDATFVQVGDFLDRGDGVFEVMDLFMRLQNEAPRYGGRVIVLWGNHEAMNLLGVLRDVSPAVFEKLAGPESEARQEKLFQAAARFWRERHKGAELPPEFEEAWKRKHPPGSYEYLERLSPRSKYGRWLRSLPSAVRVDDMFFLHAGLSPEMGEIDAEGLNERVREDFELFDDYRELLTRNGLTLPVTTFTELLEIAEDLSGGGPVLAGLSEGKAEIKRASRALVRQVDGSSLVDVHGPLWFRGFAKWRHGEGYRNTQTLARSLDVEHFIVGHSPVRDRSIHHRFDGAIFLTDTGMLSQRYKGGRASILERVGERWTAIYPDRREVLLGPGPRQALARDWPGPDDQELPFRSDAEAIEFLKTAEVVSSEPVGDGTSETTKILLVQDGVRAHAAFRSIDVRKRRVTLNHEVFLDFHDSYRYEIAAYEFSRLLGLDHVPPVVAREIEGVEGSLQLWVENAFTESERNREGQNPPDWNRWYRQLQTMRIFDRLIYNYDRNRGNILIGEDWKLWMIDHTRSFRISTEVPEIGTVTHCEKDLWRRIREIDEKDVAERLSDLLSAKQLKALMKRRDKVVERIEKLIEQYGEEYVIFDFEEVPSPEETYFLADNEIEDFLDGLPDESEMPAELRVLITSE